MNPALLGKKRRPKRNRVKMRIFRELYDIHPPHTVLCDNSYLNSFSKVDTKTQVANSLKEFIGDKMKLFITRCSLHSSQNFNGILPRGFFLARYSHVPTISASDCVEQMMRKKILPALPIVRRIGDQFHFKGPSEDERLQAHIKKEQKLAQLNG